MEKEKSSEFAFAEDILSRFDLNRRILFYLKTDPRFFFEYKKLTLKTKAGELTPRKKQLQLEALISNAEKRKLVFMINSLEETSPNGVSIEKLLEEYSKESEKYQKELKIMNKKVKEKELLELADNLDYQSMQTNFDKMEKKKLKKKTK